MRCFDHHWPGASPARVKNAHEPAIWAPRPVHRAAEMKDRASDGEDLAHTDHSGGAHLIASGFIVAVGRV
jgi:hypothetical protein